MNRKVRVFAIALLTLCSAIFAKGLKEPGRGRVLIVGKLDYKNPIDLESRENGFRKFGNILTGGKLTSSKEDDFCFKPYFLNTVNKPVKGTMDGYFFRELSVGGNSRAFLESFYVTIFGRSNFWYQFALPVDVSIVVPDDAVYVYVGTFQYDLDYALRLKGFEHIDEFDEAQNALNQELGKNVELYRATLEFRE